jgi:hypothetical protein
VCFSGYWVWPWSCRRGASQRASDPASQAAVFLNLLLPTPLPAGVHMLRLMDRGRVCLFSFMQQGEGTNQCTPVSRHLLKLTRGDLFICGVRVRGASQPAEFRGASQLAASHRFSRSASDDVIDCQSQCSQLESWRCLLHATSPRRHVGQPIDVLRLGPAANVVEFDSPVLLIAKRWRVCGPSPQCFSASGVSRRFSACDVARFFPAVHPTMLLIVSRSVHSSKPGGVFYMTPIPAVRMASHLMFCDWVRRHKLWSLTARYSYSNCKTLESMWASFCFCCFLHLWILSV